MDELETFIGQKFRPDVLGGKLDKEHKSIFHISCEDKNETNPYITINAICFGPKKDNVLINLEHVICKEDKVLIFYYEDIHQRWTYIQSREENYFLFKKNELEQYKIKPKFLYIRGCFIDPDDKYWLLIGDFFNFVEMWDGELLCAPKKQMPNESKLYQLNNSLRNSSQNIPAISLGVSYVIKGAEQLTILDQAKSYIVKSLSGVRSIVVDEQDYKKWQVNNLNNIPVLFQEKANGKDLRVHIINQHIFGKRSNIKVNIDYRYDSNFFKLENVEEIDEDLVNFCLSVAEEENNLLLGIDFIQTELDYVALEANPSSGWSAYYPFNGIVDEPFILELMRVLKSD